MKAPSASIRRDASCRAGPGFTLVELLVVMAIIVILIALVVPVVKGIAGGNQLTNAASALVAEVNLARQTALSENQEIEVRFYKLPGEAGSSAAFRAAQRFRVSNSEPLDKIVRLTAPIIMSGEPKFSTLLSSANGGNSAPTATVQGQAGVEYRSIRFRPSGSTTLDPRGANAGADRWFLSLANENKLADGTAARPADNFITIQVDPVTGRTKFYQP